MNKETQKKILVLLGTGMTISDYLEDLKDELPLLVRREHKKAFNDMIRSTKELYDRLLFGMDKQSKIELAEQLHNINVSFEDWINENFK